MIDQKGVQTSAMCQNYCKCQICTEPQHIILQKQQGQKMMKGQNCMLKFLQLLPRNFPLMISPTAGTKTKQYYFNKFVKCDIIQGNRINVLPFNKITEHFPLALHLILYYPVQTTITYKYDLLKENPNFVYLQGYSAQVPIAIKYDRNDNSDMDEVLDQKLPQILLQMQNDDYHNTSQQNRQFLKWVQKQYKQEIFCKYMTKIIFSFLQAITHDKLISASLEWIIQKNGTIKLNNVRDLIIQKKVQNKSFQDQYQEKIMDKLKKQNAIQVKLFNTYVRQPKLNLRVRNFKDQIRNFYEKQKLKIVQKTQKQRNVDSKTLSDQIARLFLPDLHHYSNLRQVLNDQEKFKKVVLGINPQKKKKLSPMHGQKQKSKVHKRSKTQM